MCAIFLQRITIAEILEDEWFKKDYKPPCFEQGEDVSLDDVDAAFNDSEVLYLKVHFEFTIVLKIFSEILCALKTFLIFYFYVHIIVQRCYKVNLFISYYFLFWKTRLRISKDLMTR
jgi:hypothetical protein